MKFHTLLNKPMPNHHVVNDSMKLWESIKPGDLIQAYPARLITHSGNYTISHNTDPNEVFAVLSVARKNLGKQSKFVEFDLSLFGNNCVYKLFNMIEKKRLPKQDLSYISTRELLAGRLTAHLNGNVVIRGIDLTEKQLKAELAKRPHVPNKKESKILRRQKNFDGRNKGKKNK